MMKIRRPRRRFRKKTRSKVARFLVRWSFPLVMGLSVLIFGLVTGWWTVTSWTLILLKEWFEFINQKATPVGPDIVLIFITIKKRYYGSC